MARHLIDWPSIIKKVQEELLEYEKREIKPTLRAMFYKLYSKGVIRNTRSDYSGLSEHTAEARENWIRKVGDEDERLPPDCFLDEIHSVLEIDDVYRSPEERIDKYIKTLTELPEKYPALPRWYNQPEYVEIWIEKTAMVAEFRSILNEAGLEVRLVPHGGYISFTFLNESVQRLLKFVREGKNIHILYFGDFDRSGEQMFDDIKDRLQRIWGLKNTRLGYSWQFEGEKKSHEVEFDFTLERIAITKEQVEKYDLPSEPLDDKMRAKLENDTRTPAFTKKHGAVYQSELDALPIFILPEFKEMVVDSVNQYFKQETYDRELEAHEEEHSEETIKTLVKTKVNDFANELSNAD